jgi:hypothetical protein
MPNQNQMNGDNLDSVSCDAGKTCRQKKVKMSLKILEACTGHKMNLSKVINLELPW